MKNLQLNLANLMFAATMAEAVKLVPTAAGKTILTLNENNTRSLENVAKNATALAESIRSSNMVTTVGLWKTEYDNIYIVHNGNTRITALGYLSAQLDFQESILNLTGYDSGSTSKLAKTVELVFQAEVTEKPEGEFDQLMVSNLSNNFQTLTEAEQVKAADRMMALNISELIMKLKSMGKPSKIFATKYFVSEADQSKYLVSGKESDLVIKKRPFFISTQLFAGNATGYDLALKNVKAIESGKTYLESIKNIVTNISNNSEINELDAAVVGNDTIVALQAAFAAGATQMQGIDDAAGVTLSEEMATSILRTYVLGSKMLAQAHLNKLLAVHTAIKVLEGINKFIVPEMVGKYSQYSILALQGTKVEGKITKSDTDAIGLFAEQKDIEAAQEKAALVKAAEAAAKFASKKLNSNDVIVGYYHNTFCVISEGTGEAVKVTELVTKKRLIEALSTTKRAYQEYSALIVAHDIPDMQDDSPFMTKYSRVISDTNNNKITEYPSHETYAAYDISKWEEITTKLVAFAQKLKAVKASGELPSDFDALSDEEQDELREAKTKFAEALAKAQAAAKNSKENTKAKAIDLALTTIRNQAVTSNANSIVVATILKMCEAFAGEVVNLGIITQLLHDSTSKGFGADCADLILNAKKAADSNTEELPF